MTEHPNKPYPAHGTEPPAGPGRPSPLVWRKADLGWALVSYLALFIPLFAYFQYSGLKVVGDAVMYLDQADSVLQLWKFGPADLSWLSWLDPFYLFSVGLLALLKELAGPHWPTAILLMNAAAYALCAPCLYLGFRLGGGVASWAVALACVLLPLGCPEVFILGPIPLRDVPFVGGAAVVTLVLIRLAAGRTGWPAWLAAGVLAAVLFLFRPTSLVLPLAGLGLFWVVRGGGIPWRRGRALGGLLVLAGLLAALGMVLNWWSAAPFSLPWDKLEGVLAAIRELSGKGVVVVDQPDTYVLPPRDFWDFLRLWLLKMVYYFRYWNPGQSLPHQVYRHLYFGVLFLNFLWSLGSVWLAPGRTEGEVRRRLSYLILLLALLAAGVQSLVALPFEFRPQMILLPALWTLLLLNLDHWRRGFRSPPTWSSETAPEGEQ